MSRNSSSDPAVTPPPQADRKGRILPFRRPGALPKHNIPALPPDLTEFEHRTGEPDDYRHRMIMNALGFAATVVLIVVGIWIADVMAHMRKDQDCVLTGRAGCTPVDAPLRRR